MTEFKYDGKSGWGVIPDHRKTDRPPRTVQNTLFSRHDSMPSDEEKNFTPPVAITKAKAPRDPNDVFLPLQTKLEFTQSDPATFEVMQSPIPGFRDRRLYQPPGRISEVELPNKIRFTVPENFEQMHRLYNLDFVNLTTLFFIDEQARGVTIANEINDRNLFFEADTSFGKTILELLIAATELRKEAGQVVLITPTVDLVDQIYKDANLYLKLPEGMAAKLSGQVPASKRKEIYNDPKIRFLISTPDIFEHDLKNGLVPASRFTLAAMDEGDKGVGDTGYNSAGKILADAGVRIRAFSATLPDKEHRMYEMLDAFQIEKESIYKLHSPQKKIFRKTIFVKLTDPEMLDAASALYNSAAHCAEELERALKEAIKVDNGELREEAKILSAFQKITKLNKNTFEIPSNADTTPIITALEKACKNDRKRFGLCLSLMAELGYRAHLYHTLTRFGKFAFLNTVASDICSYKFHIPRKKGKKRGLYFEKVYRDKNLYDVYSKLGEGTSFMKLLKTTTTFGGIVKELDKKPWHAEKKDLEVKYETAKSNHAKKIAKSEEPEKVIEFDSKIWWIKQWRKYARDIRDAFLKKVSDEIAAKPDWYDGPGLSMASDFVRLHCTFGRGDQVIVTTDSAENALFFPKPLTNIVSAIGKVAVPFAGMVHMPVEDRKENLDLFKVGDAEVLVGTNGAIQLGVHSGATVLICLNTEVTVAGQRQILGRIGRKGQVAYVYDIVIEGTADFTRLYAAYHRMKDEGHIAHDR